MSVARSSRIRAQVINGWWRGFADGQPLVEQHHGIWRKYGSERAALRAARAHTRATDAALSKALADAVGE
jgi:hypothetical protein